MARGGADSATEDKRGASGSPATPGPAPLLDAAAPPPAPAEAPPPVTSSDAIAKVAASATAVAEQVLSQVTGQVPAVADKSPVQAV